MTPRCVLLDNEDVVECGAASAAVSNRLSFLCCESGFKEALLYVCVCVCVYDASEIVRTCVYVCMHQH